MSTEARRASIPPHPPLPPRPTTPPAVPEAAGDADAGTQATDDGTTTAPPMPARPPYVGGWRPSQAAPPPVPPPDAPPPPRPRRTTTEPNGLVRPYSTAPWRPSTASAGTGNAGSTGSAGNNGEAQPRPDTAPKNRPAAPVPAPPPPPPSARFPDTPPPGGAARANRSDGIVEVTGRHEQPAAPRPFVTLGQPETYDERIGRSRPLGLGLGARVRPRIAGAAACLVLGLGLIGGAVTGSWLTGDGSADSGSGTAYTAAGQLWHSVPVGTLFPATVDGTGAGPGGADRTWTRIGVAPDTNCADAFDPLLRKALAPVGCLRLLRATYTDATQSHVITVGLLFTKADAPAMSALATRFKNENLAARTDLMPRPYAVKGTVAAGFGDDQRASWTLSILTDAPVVVYAVSGFADGRAVTDPQPAAAAMQTGATTDVAQAGLGQEAQGLADRVERGLNQSADQGSSGRPYDTDGSDGAAESGTVQSS